MANPIIEKILGKNIETQKYIKDVINLAKSIVIKNNIEAKLYNDYVLNKSPYTQIENNKNTWRYYKHLNCENYTVNNIDKDIYVYSIEKQDNILLTRKNMLENSITRNNLLEFSSFYDSLVSKYPEQELYIRACISDYVHSNSNNITDNDNIDLTERINGIINLPDFTIVSYSKLYIEENEDNLIEELQNELNNYKLIRLIQHYSVSDSLYLPSMYTILYQFIVLKILAIRLKNCKTIRAHSYHVKNYLSSFHDIGNYINYLDKKIIMYLYKNILYLNNNHSKNNIFRDIVNNLFNASNTSVVNYKFNQTNSIVSNTYDILFKFNEKLINNKPLLYSNSDYFLSDIRKKESETSIQNEKEWTLNESKIKSKLDNTLHGTLNTKNIEILSIDNTNSVKYKIIDTISNYWGYLLLNNKIKFGTVIDIPDINKTIQLSITDLFKLYLICLYLVYRNNILFNSNNVDVPVDIFSNINELFPKYSIYNIYRENISEQDVNNAIDNISIYGINLETKQYYKNRLNAILNTTLSSPSMIVSNIQFKEYIDKIQNANLSSWLLLSNVNNSRTEADLEALFNSFKNSYVYNVNNNETIYSFLSRLDILDLLTIDKNKITNLIFFIFSKIYDNSIFNNLSYTEKQLALSRLFVNFTSYTTNIIENYIVYNSVLSGNKDTRYVLTRDIITDYYYIRAYKVDVNLKYKFRDKQTLNILNSNLTNSNDIEIMKYNIDVSTYNKINTRNIFNVPVIFNFKINDLGINNWVSMLPATNQLIFLATNT